MAEKNKDIMELIKKETEEVQVPEGLRPEQILKTLEDQGEERRKSSRQKKRKWIVRGATVAAACLVAVVGFNVYLKNLTKSDGISGGGTTASTDGSESEITISKEKNIKVADNYEDAYAYLETYSKRMQSESYGTEMYARDGGTASSENQNEIATLESDAAADSTSSAANSEAAKAVDTSGSGYSETNVRQDGVDEGDTVKTDGNYLYVLKDNSKEISIVDANASAMKSLQTIQPEDIDTIREFYLDKDQHYVIAVCEKQISSVKEINAYNYWNPVNTVMVTYDVSDIENPKELGRITQNGNYESSRKVGDYVYLFSDYSIYLDGMKKSEPETYVPLVNGEKVAASDIFLPAVSEGYEYSVITLTTAKQSCRMAEKCMSVRRIFITMIRYGIM